jgi:hypothetical protein
MDEIILQFPEPLNVSVQIGDTVYYTNDPNGRSIVQIGIITDIGVNTITAQIPNSTIRPTLTSFILFSKTNLANAGGLKGYYMETTLKNDSNEKIELFSVGSEIFESSK